MPLIYAFGKRNCYSCISVDVSDNIAILLGSGVLMLVPGASVLCLWACVHAAFVIILQINICGTVSNITTGQCHAKAKQYTVEFHYGAHSPWFILLCWMLVAHAHLSSCHFMFIHERRNHKVGMKLDVWMWMWMQLCKVLYKFSFVMISFFCLLTCLLCRKIHTYTHANPHRLLSEDALAGIKCS